MKDKINQVKSVLSRFHEQGWVDLDEILELLTKKIPVSASNSTDTTDKLNSAQEILQRKIAALMDLADLSDVQREQLIEKCKTVEQLQELHNEWEEKINDVLGVRRGKSEGSIQEDQHTDYSNFHSGHKEKKYLI
jgi:hypothetical protein